MTAPLERKTCGGGKLKRKNGLILIYCGLLVVYDQIYGLMVRFLGGGWDVVMVVVDFFLSSRFGFLGVV